MTRFGGLLYTYENNHSTILYLVMVQFSSLMILPALFDLCKSLKQDIKRVKMTSMSRFAFCLLQKCSLQLEAVLESVKNTPV